MYGPLSGSAPRVNSWLDGQTAIRSLTQDFATSFNKAAGGAPAPHQLDLG